MKKNKFHNIELLSPVGSYEALTAAIQAKADSIYFGVEQLNMRASGCNFSIEDLPKISKICYDNNLKSYLTLNTVIFDNDISSMKRIIDKAAKNKINAIVANDQAVLNYTKQKKIETHISTQSNVSNIEAVKFYSHYADVIVLARELTLQQVEKIVKEIKRKKITGPSGKLIRIEVFAHGALCMAVSGKCYMSLHSYNASANRGICIQNCRRSYTVIDKQDGIELKVDNEYIMSAKDLCTIDFIDKILITGISILKIEGRNRPADYVYTVTKCYREAIDAFQSGTYAKKKIMNWKKQLTTVMNRGQWEGYYLGKKMGEWCNQYGSQATKQKIYIGKVINYFQKAQAGEFKIESDWLCIGDEILIMGPTTGVIQSIVKELRIENISTNKVAKGTIVTIPFEKKIRPSDKLYKIIKKRN
ncbi:MAG: peptidase U32 family protein [Bacteroidota bacterium]